MAETVLSVQYVRGKATYQYAASVVSQSIFTTGEEEGRSSRIEMPEVLCAVDASPKEKDSRCRRRSTSGNGAPKPESYLHRQRH